MPPLPGSPAINAAIDSTFTTDQRGFAITDGFPDVGAVELRSEDITTIVNNFDNDSDDDGDGNPFLLELALGTDPFLADAGSERNLRITFENDLPQLTFGYISNTRNSISLQLQKSNNLATFGEVLMNLNDDPNLENFDSTELFQVTDPDNDQKAFYRLKAEAIQN